jgi:hypothetical protein
VIATASNMTFVDMRQVLLFRTYNCRCDYAIEIFVGSLSVPLSPLNVLGEFL